MAASYFEVVDESDERARYRASGATAGPWAADLQHGGPPNALLVAAAERLVTARVDDAVLTAARLAAELVGPVPVAEVSTSAHIVRAARSAVLVAAELAADGRSCVQARIWFVARRDTSRVAAAAAPPQPLSQHAARGLGISFPYGESIEWRIVHGGPREPGPAAAWARPLLPVVEGRPMSGLQRAALIGDSASGLSAALDWDQWSFVNVDLDVHLARPVRGDWLLMDAATQLGGDGFALARSTLSDQDGMVGATAQTLILAPRRQ